MARYYLRFRQSDTGLAPIFTYFKAVSDHSDVGSPPAINELSNGTYYFDYTPTFPITYLVDADDAGIVDETIRYIAGVIRPEDIYLDEPISQVKTDVWEDTTAYADGEKGKRVDDIGAAADDSTDATLFGRGILHKESVRGDTAGTSDGNNVEEVFDRLGAPVGASLAADIAAVKADTATTTGLSAQLTRALGLMHENSVIDNTVFDGSNNLTAARMRIYNSRANALLAGAGGLVATYTITATYVGSNISTYTVVLEP